jgi:hypothetical protein
VAINEVRGANDFKLIHAQGKTCVENPVIDELFDVPFDNTIKIRRIVEMRMWEETWAEAFERKQLSVESIKRGLNKCEDEFQKYPPSMPAFLQCCKGEVIPMAQRGFPLMLEQKLTTEQRKEGLKKLRVAKDSITIKTDDTGDGYE